MTAPRIPLYLNHQRPRERRARWAFFGGGLVCGLCVAALWVSL